MKWKWGVYAGLVCWVVYCLWLGVQIHTLEFERDALREEVEILEIEMQIHWQKCPLRIVDPGEPMDSIRLDSIYQEIIVDPLQKWIDEHGTYRIQITIPETAGVEDTLDYGIYADYDSVVVIDGIIYERAVGANTAHNNGVGIPFKGVEL